MNNPQWIFALATLLGAIGMWLLLPRGLSRSGRVRGGMIGALLAAAAVGVFASQLPLLGGWIEKGVFFVLAGVTILAAIATVTLRNPIYCAVWFGMSLLGTAGLFLLAGAQFLAVATIVVYAGAILVTFLFVLMLAQPKGQATYDRVSWEALVSAAAGMVIVGVLSVTVSRVLGVWGDDDRVMVMVAAAAPSPETLKRGVLAREHVAHLGEELFGRHLIAVEVAGTLLLAALVGAAVIVAEAKAD